MSKLYDTFDSQADQLTQAHGNGNVIYLLNRSNVNKSIQIIAHAPNVTNFNFPTVVPIVNDNNQEASREIENNITEISACLAPFKVNSNWDLTCTGAQYDVAFEIDNNAQYWVQLDQSGQYTNVQGMGLTNYLNNHTNYTAFTDASAPPILTEINCMPGDLGYNYSTSIAHNSDQGVILKYQIDENPPVVYRTQTTSGLGSLNTTTFFNDFVAEFNLSNTDTKIRINTTNLATTAVTNNGVESFNFVINNHNGDHLILPFGTRAAEIVGVPGTPGNSHPRVLRFMKYTEATFQSIDIRPIGQGGLVDIFSSLFNDAETVEIQSCGLGTSD